ncbi:MAG: Rab family GTPase [Candidatus Thorarchaeota archaeon]
MRDQDDGSKVVKSVLIGDAAVGKTSIRRNYLGEGFEASHLPTIGVDLATKKVLFGDDLVKFVIWDLAGQHNFKSVRGHYYHGSNGIILVYDVVNRESFFNASKWLVEAYRNMGPLPPTIIVGNKIDLRQRPEYTDVVTTEEGKAFRDKFIEKLGVPAVFKETSAKTGENIDDTFTELLAMMEKDRQREAPEIYQSESAPRIK